MSSLPRGNLLRAGFIACALLAARLMPLRTVESVSLCIFYHLTGRRCPGCGMTRGVTNLLHGNWERALEYNPLSPLVLALILLLLVDELICILYALRSRSRRSIIERVLGIKKR